MGKKQNKKQSQSHQNLKKTTQVLIKQRGRPKKLKNEPQIQSSDQSCREFDEDKETIESVLMEFFEKIEQRDLVFKSNTRQVLRSLYPQKNITLNDEYHPVEENQKIQKSIKNLNIFKYLQQININTDELKEKFQYFYEEGAKLFPSQVTSQLHNMLSNASNIVFAYRKDSGERLKRLRNYGDKIPSQKYSDQYFYFGFHMFSLPAGKKQEDIKRLTKHNPHFQYILKQEYRLSNGPYANFMQKIGELIYELMESLACKQRLFV